MISKTVKGTQVKGDDKGVRGIQMKQERVAMVFRMSNRIAATHVHIEPAI